MGVIVSDIDGTILRSGIYPIQRTIDFLKSEDKKNNIVLITGRQESERSKTEISLKKAGVPYDSLKMNGFGDSREDQLKSKKKNISSLLGNASLIIENDAETRKMYESMGFKTMSPEDL
jgi:ribonucleotide monophosphatase NagD (HAD superfamily)